MGDEHDIAESHEAFEQGKQAALGGQQASVNPYTPGSREHKHWLKGYEFVEKFDEDGEVPSDT